MWFGIRVGDVPVNIFIYISVDCFSEGNSIYCFSVGNSVDCFLVGNFVDCILVGNMVGNSVDIFVDILFLP
jgi:hypothetical protein